MRIELDYEIVAALESALIVAEVSKAHDAKQWSDLAESMEAPEKRRAAENMAAFCQQQADSYRKAMAALQKAKGEGPHA